MVNFLIIALIALLLVFILFKWNNARTRLAFLFIILGVSFLLLTGYLIFSGKEVNLKTVGGISDAAKTYVSWLGNAGANIVKVSTYAFKQNWKGDVLINDSSG